MEDSKPFYLSKTFWGALVAGLVALGGALGFELPGGGEGLADEIVTAIAAAFALIGRFTAKSKLTAS
jgi:hypothetical protein